jgi:hypothetical protein
LTRRNLESSAEVEIGYYATIFRDHNNNINYYYYSIHLYYCYWFARAPVVEGEECVSTAVGRRPIVRVKKKKRVDGWDDGRDMLLIFHTKAV